METTSAEPSKVRFERDGDVGVGLARLADPPLNLFGRDLIADPL